jgi:hypothetical protein
LVAKPLGVSTETLRRRVTQTEVDTGIRDGILALIEDLVDE